MSGLDEKGRYCTCNSKTNPCIVCSKPKFIDPEWLKRKIEEEPDGMEVGAGFEIFSTPDTVAATPADVGELVERLREKANKLDDMQGFSAPSGKLEREAATALERVVRERDTLRARLETVEAETRELRARNDPMRVLGDPRVGVTIDEASLKELKRVLATIGGATP